MNGTIKVYWAQRGYREGNFGDKITPLILDYLGLKYKWAPPESAHLIGVGSLLESVPDNFAGTIWTTGQLYESTRKDLSRASVLAARGRLTLERVQCRNKAAVGLGDGGLLCHLFYRPARKRYKLGLVPHFADFEDPILRQIKSSSSEITLVDLCAKALDVIQVVGQCEYVLSSSLHGLVLADSLKIPNRWIELNHGPRTVLGQDFEFRDYYSIFGMEHVQPAKPSARDYLDSVMPLFDGYSRPGIDALQQALLQNLQSLAALAERIDPQQEAREAAECEAWFEPLPEVLKTIATLIPPGETFIVVDEDQFRSEIDRPGALPFLENQGQYWGPPADDADAIAELERLRRAGARFLVVAWPAFWWLDYYTGWRDYLQARFPCLFQNPSLLIYDLRPRP